MARLIVLTVAVAARRPVETHRRPQEFPGSCPDVEERVMMRKWIVSLNIAWIFLFISFAAAQDKPAPSFEPVCDGPFKPSWDSLKKQFQVPDWYRDAKFGIIAHWGPQCQPEMGDWYAQRMYQPENDGESTIHCISSPLFLNEQFATA